MASYDVNDDAVEKARALIDARQYVLDSDWGDVQPTADDENAYLADHTWAEYGSWHLGLTVGAHDETKALAARNMAFVGQMSSSIHLITFSG